jgi:hypothetical protein
MKKHAGWLLFLCMLGVGFMVGGVHLRSARADGANRVGLVVAYGDGTVVEQCISFSTDKITGLEALQAAGLPLEIDYSSIGAAVCKIGNVGCPADNCFCDSPPNFWSYWHLKDGNWAFSQLGAGISRVSDGDVEGWIWGPGQSNPPDQVSFNQICTEQPTPTEIATTESTAAPTLAPTETPTTTSTKEPTLTPTKMLTPTRKPTKTPTPTTDESSPIQAFDQPTHTSEPAQAREQPTESSVSSTAAQPVYLPMVSKMEAPPEDTPLPTEIAASSTPIAIAQVPTIHTPVAIAQVTTVHTPTYASTLKVAPPQTGEGDLAATSSSKTSWGSYLFLVVIVVGLGIGLYGVTHKKWK